MGFRLRETEYAHIYFCLDTTETLPYAILLFVIVFFEFSLFSSRPFFILEILYLCSCELIDEFYSSVTQLSYLFTQSGYIMSSSYFLCYEPFHKMITIFS